MTPAPECRKEERKRTSWYESRLRRHSDYQRVYANSRKQFSASMTYFFALRPDEAPARVGLTAGRVLGKAVERNRIKRRMREAVRKHWSQLPAGVDVVLHPRKRVMTMDFADLDGEVGTVFDRVAKAVAKERREGIEPGVRPNAGTGEHGPGSSGAGEGRARP